jgi:PhoPQ-activated pathogenicity-related protein
VKPAGVPTGKMLLLNEGGSASMEKAMYAALLAGKIKAPVALLLGVPNQPLFGGKKEDDLIAETFVRYLESGDASWPLLFPMVKSVVKGMDSLQEFSKKEWGEPVEKFIVGGGSKRGWTTWLTAASDPRVMAITPMVIDVLNMRNQLSHQQSSLGGVSKQISPYTSRGLVPIPDTPRAESLWSMIDPWTYRERFTMPKLIVLGNNDAYWSTDALNLYWDALPGEKYISYTPNAGHDLTERDAAGKKLHADRAINNVSAFVRYQLSGKPLPKLGWKHTTEADGGLRLTVTADPAPREARLWVARSNSRDFREARWESQAIELKAGEPVTASVAKPEKGFIAYYADLGYEIDGLPQWLCTQLRVVGTSAE